MTRADTQRRTRPTSVMSLARGHGPKRCFSWSKLGLVSVAGSMAVAFPAAYLASHVEYLAFMKQAPT